MWITTSKLQSNAGCEQHAKVETENRRHKLNLFQPQHVLSSRVPTSGLPLKCTCTQFHLVRDEDDGGGTCLFYVFLFACVSCLLVSLLLLLLLLLQLLCWLWLWWLLWLFWLLVLVVVVVVVVVVGGGCCWRWWWWCLLLLLLLLSVVVVVVVVVST